MELLTNRGWMNKWILFISLFLPNAAFSSIAFDAVVASSMTGSTSPLSISVTVASNSNRYMLINCATVGALSVTGVTVGGSAATKLTEHDQSSSNRAYQYGYANPGTGSVVVSVSYSAGDDSNINCAAFSLYGVAQTSSVDVSTATDANGTQYINVSATTSNDNSWIVDMVYPFSNSAATKDASQTLRYTFANATQGTWSGGSTKATTTAGSYTMQWDVNWNQSILIWTALNEATASSSSGPTGQIITTTGDGMVSTNPGAGRISLE